jgi:hypothetical protein
VIACGKNKKTPLSLVAGKNLGCGKSVIETVEAAYGVNTPVTSFITYTQIRIITARFLVASPDSYQLKPR